MKSYRLFLLIALSLLLVFAAGCGGGEETPEPQPTSAPEPTAVPDTGGEDDDDEDSSGGEVSAGYLDYMLDPTFGEDSLESGFMPDPYTVELISGGNIDVGVLGLGSECTGYALDAPDFRLNWSGESPFGMNIFFVPMEAGEDATLIINDPNGNWHCNDDYYMFDPLIEFAETLEGQYDIWIGSYLSDEYIEGTLYITELGLDPESVQGDADGGDDDGGMTGGQLDFTQPPNYGEEYLEAGFLPDPFELPMTSGGPVDVYSLDLGPSCTGYATSAPDFRFQWSGDAMSLRIFFASGGDFDDTTLIINDPYGNWVCSDDAAGTFSPMVEIDNPEEGQYDVWVGSYSESELIDGTLYITELDYDPSNLP
jgi:serine protease Do